MPQFYLWYSGSTSQYELQAEKTTNLCHLNLSDNEVFVTLLDAKKERN